MRLTSLDVFRGITIAAMLLVNMAGVAPQAYPILEHAHWHGCKPADLIFPFFLFIIGVAIAFSFSKYTLPGKRPTPALYRRIGSRSAILFGLGLLLNGFYRYDLSSLRLMGVLQRIALVYLLVSWMVLHLSRRWQWLLIGLILLGYWLAMTLIPVPNYGVGNLTPEGNLASYLDRLFLGIAHLYPGEDFNSMGDPEGLLSTLPAAVTVMLGHLTGDWLREQPHKSDTSLKMVIFGLACLMSGQLWSVWFPLNKKLWTSSFVLITAGWALLLLAACYELIEVRQRRLWGKPFQVMGLNAIFVFLASVLLIKILVKTPLGFAESAPTLYVWLYENWFLSWASPLNSSLFLSLVTLLFWWGIAYGMYRQGWFLKI